MKNQLPNKLLTLVACAIFLTLPPLKITAQQETAPLTKFIGQIFEQGYGQTGDEEGIDLMQYNDGTAMCGWSYFEEDEYTAIEFGTTPNYNNFDIDATYWLMDKIGDQQWEVRILNGGTDDIATGICPSNIENEGFNFVSCVRHTTVYGPNEVVSVDDELSVWLLDASGAYSLLYQHQRDEETFAGIAPVDIKRVTDGYLILANAIDYLENTSVVLIRIDNIGQLIDYEVYNGGEGESYLTYEMKIASGNNAVFALNELQSFSIAMAGYEINSWNSFTTSLAR